MIDIMAVPVTAIIGPQSIIRLGQLGVTTDELNSALLIGYGHAADCTEHEPASLPGTLVWGKGIGHLRDVKRAEGWTANHRSNFETVVHPSNSHCIAITAGTRETGLADGVPRTRTPRGPATKRAVVRNAQLSLDEGRGIFAGTGEPVDDQDRETWLLLHCLDRKAGVIRAELSSPLELKEKQITAWRERILLEPVAFSTTAKIEFEDIEDEPIDIVIQRKAD
jgi:hypothetical protein